MSNPGTTTDQAQYIFNKVFHPTAQALVTTPVDDTGTPITTYPTAGLSPDGSSVTEPATLTTMYDGNSGASTESLAGVNLRQVGASGSVEAGTAANPWNVTAAEYPYGATALVAASGSAGNSIRVATLTGAVDKTTYITGFEVTAAGATAGLPVSVTVAGLVGGITLTYTFVFPAGVLVAAEPLVVQFPRAIPSSATNTNIVVTVPAGGAGNTHSTVTAHGYLL